MKPTINLTTRIFAIIFASVNILGITACTKESGAASGSNIQRQSGNVQSNAASAFTAVNKFNVSITVSIPCANNGNGEDVTLEGTLHETYHLTTNNNKFQLKIIDNPQGISGIGSVTGDKYQATGETQQQFGGTFINGQYEASYINNFKIIGQGRGNNFLVHENYHITINANGTVTATLDNISVECK